MVHVHLVAPAAHSVVPDRPGHRVQDSRLDFEPVLRSLVEEGDRDRSLPCKFRELAVEVIVELALDLEVGAVFP